MSKEYSASRVTVLDAAHLDVSIYSILKKQINVIRKYLPPGFLVRFEAELDLILRAILWELSIERGRATFGQEISKLKYQKDASMSRLRLLGVLSIGAQYAKARQGTLIKYTNNSPIVEKILQYFEIAVKSLNILSLVIYLRKGTCPSFAELILGLRPVSTVPNSARNVGYAYMTRELLWHGFMEFIAFLLPFINFPRVRKWLRFAMQQGARKKMARRSKSPVLKVGVKCAVCGESPIIPSSMGCPHVFCYYCLAVNREADSSFECPQCGFSNPAEDALKQIKIR